MEPGLHGELPSGSRNRQASDPAAVLRRLLAPGVGFTDALSRIYGTDLSRGFRGAAIIRSLQPSAAFLADDDYRRQVIGELCRRTLARDGFVAIRPADGMAHGLTSMGDELALCHLFGASGFAQLCDDAMDRPVPMFLQPWSQEQGLLAPRNPPAESFSRTLCVERLGAGRMVLFDARSLSSTMG